MSWRWTILAAGLAMLVCAALYFLGGVFAVFATIVLCVFLSILVIRGVVVMRLRMVAKSKRAKQDVAFDLPPSHLARAVRSRDRRQSRLM
jgi:hypothetical protein